MYVRDTPSAGRTRFAQLYPLLHENANTPVSSYTATQNGIPFEDDRYPSNVTSRYAYGAFSVTDVADAVNDSITMGATQPSLVIVTGPRVCATLAAPPADAGSPLTRYALYVREPSSGGRTRPVHCCPESHDNARAPVSS